MLACLGTQMDINWDGEKRENSIPGLALPSPKTSKGGSKATSLRKEEKRREFFFFAKRIGGPAGLHFPGCGCEFE